MSISPPGGLLIKHGHQWLSLHCGCCYKRISVPVSCGSRYCDVCGVKRRNRTRSRMVWIQSLVKLKPGQRIKFLTLTLRSESDLAKMVTKLIKSFRKLRSSKYWKSLVDGGYYVIEVTGRPGAWHAHLHIVMQSYFIDWETLLGKWHRLTGALGVWVENIDPRDAAGYLTKYLSKSKIQDKGVDEMNESLQGRRLFQPFGSWHSLSVSYVQPESRCPSCDAKMWICLDFLLDAPIDVGVIRPPPLPIVVVSLQVDLPF